MYPILRPAALLGLGAALALTCLPAAADPTPPPHPEPPRVVVTTLSEDVFAPYNLAVRRGNVYVAEGSIPAVRKLTKDGLVTLATGPAGGDVSGVDVTADALAYTSSESLGPQDPVNGKLIVRTTRHGKVSTVTTDLEAYEDRYNPDGRVTYGIDHPSDCVKAAYAKIGQSASMPGRVDAHPYAVTSVGHGFWVVADAGANDLLLVGPQGRVLASLVIPRQPVVITLEAAQQAGLDSCVVGQSYYYESVPTDVELGPNGVVYVSTLPGGPEDPSAGARGSVYTLDVRHWQLKRLATGFAGATNLAVTRDGTVYVAELFGGKISRVDHSGAVQTLTPLPGALSVEAEGNTLYAGTFGAFTGGKGSIVKIETVGS